MLQWYLNVLEDDSLSVVSHPNKISGHKFLTGMIWMIVKEIQRLYSCSICYKLHWKVYNSSILGIFVWVPIVFEHYHCYSGCGYEVPSHSSRGLMKSWCRILSYGKSSTNCSIWGYFSQKMHKYINIMHQRYWFLGQQGWSYAETASPCFPQIK